MKYRFLCRFFFIRRSIAIFKESGYNEENWKNREIQPHETGGIVHGSERTVNRNGNDLGIYEWDDRTYGKDGLCAAEGSVRGFCLSGNVFSARGAGERGHLIGKADADAS